MLLICSWLAFFLMYFMNSDEPMSQGHIDYRQGGPCHRSRDNRSESKLSTLDLPRPLVSADALLTFLDDRLLLSCQRTQTTMCFTFCGRVWGLPLAVESIADLSTRIWPCKLPLE